MIVRSKVKELLKENEMRSSEEFVQKLSEEVENIVRRAVERAKENNRKTVQKQDI